MNDRARAIEILRRARDLVAERLTERVLDSTDEILEDALGMSYAGELEAIYEQMGMRLCHLNSLIANLPPVDEPSAEEPTAPCDRPTPPTADVEHAGARGRTLALPAPPAAIALPVPLQGTTIHGFAIAVAGGNTASGGRMLAELFGLPPARGVQCAEMFHDKLERDPEMMLRAIQLLHEIAAGNFSGSLVLLWECFGLRGSESIGVLQTLTTRMTLA